MAPGGSERSRAERHHDILSAAERVFMRDGFAVATMDAIAQEAGVSKGGLYRYVTCKDELFLTILAQNATELETLLRRAREQGSPNGYAALEGYVSVVVEFAREREGRFRLALDSSGIRDFVEPHNTALPAFNAASERLVDLAIDVLRRGQEDGTIRSDIHVHALALALWGALVGSLQLERHLTAVTSRTAATAGAPGTDLVMLITSAARPSSAQAARNVQEGLQAKRTG